MSLASIAQIRPILKSSALRAIYNAGLHGLNLATYSGMEAIWLVHRVVHQKKDSLATSLTITANFLDLVLTYFGSRVELSDNG